jgi:hypothetical protein
MAKFDILCVTSAIGKHVTPAENLEQRFAAKNAEYGSATTAT